MKEINYWICTDLHLGHDNIIEYCNRPQNHESLILSNLRKSMEEKDILICTGDICFKNDAVWHQKLLEISCFKRWLIVGNHDKKSYSWYLQNGWDLVSERLVLKLFGHTIMFSHKPHEDTKDYTINIHGHLHNSNHHIVNGHYKQYLVAMELNDYKPYNLRELIVDFERRNRV